MSAHPVPLRPVKKQDPAGLDRVLLAAGKASHDFFAAKLAKWGIQLDWWSGENGLEAVIQDAIREHEIPNKRFPELVSPRSIAVNMGVVGNRRDKMKKRRLPKR